MSIRLMAKDLYAAQQNVDQLEKKMAESSNAELLELAGELKFALKERDILRRMLDGEKESGIFRQKFEGFGRTKK
jgi:shikimate kinase